MIDFARKNFGGERGLGIDSDPAKVAAMREHGLGCIEGDITSRMFESGSFRFVTMSHVLEHLGSLADVESAIREASRAATDFLFIQGPYFDADDFLAKKGLKFYWSDWTGHTCHLRVKELVEILHRLGLDQTEIKVIKRITSSADPSLHPLSSLPDQHAYDPSIHPAKPHFDLEAPVWGEVVAYVALRPVENWDEIIRAREGAEAWIPIDYDAVPTPPAGVDLGTDLKYFCPACDQPVSEFLSGPGGKRPHARCPQCQSLERHRFLALLLGHLDDHIGPATVIDIAPHSPIRKLLRESSRCYVAIDRVSRLKPDVVGDATALPFREGTADLVLCYHVLEHVPDDAAAISEISRVLSRAGLALVQVPQKPDEPTVEDPSADWSERERRFGQADHVRLYGSDFERRLLAKGLMPTVLWPSLVLPENQLERFGLIPHERVWLCRSMTSARQSPQTLDHLEREVAAITARYEALRWHPLISAGITLTRPIRRITKRLRQT